MRLWSFHPQYLDTKGLLAVWREGLLAQAVLLGRTRGYTAHPQLQRFRSHEDPAGAVAAYLGAVAEEGERRGYRFDRSRITGSGRCPRSAGQESGPHGEGLWSGPQIEVTAGQLDFEWKHYLEKIARRAPDLHAALSETEAPEAHPVFLVVPGPVESWEKGRRTT